MLCVLETSGKWPDDMEALRRVKLAYRIQLSQKLHSQYDLKTRVEAEHVDVLKVGEQ